MNVPCDAMNKSVPVFGFWSSIIATISPVTFTVLAFVFYVCELWATPLRLSKKIFQELRETCHDLLCTCSTWG